MGDSIPPVLDEALGWVFVVVLGGLFSVFAIWLFKFEARKTNFELNAESFATAGRSLGAGLVISDMVSKWTWAATLLMASHTCWRVGISGAYWYAAGACIQISLFAMLAVQVKKRAPNMRTFLEVIKARWGWQVHCVFIFFALTTNVIVSAMLILGGAATISALTGMNTAFASVLLPMIACLPYVFAGGLRATFLAHYVNVVFIFIILFIFMFVGYASGGSDYYGSTDKVYAGLQNNAYHAVTKHTAYPFPGMAGQTGYDDDGKLIPMTDASKYSQSDFGSFIGNQGLCYKTGGKFDDPTDKTCKLVKAADGSKCGDQCADWNYDVQSCGHIFSTKAGHCIQTGGGIYETTDCDQGEICVPQHFTMSSPSGIIFGIVNIVGNFGTVFVDQSYWQGAVAAKPKVAGWAFLIGGVVWFAVPQMMASVNGLIGRSLTQDMTLDRGVGYISGEDSGSGLTPARVAVVMQGSFGAVLLLLILFMAILSTGSAEIAAVSSILSFDVFGEYIHPWLGADRKQRRRLFYKVASDVMSGKIKQDMQIEDRGMTMTKDSEMSDDSPSRQGSKTFSEAASGFSMNSAGKRKAQVIKLTNKELIKLAKESITVKQMDDMLFHLTLNSFFSGGGRDPSSSEISGALSKVSPFCESKDALPLEPLFYALDMLNNHHNPQGKVMLRAQKFFAIVYAVIMGFVAMFLAQLGLGLGWVYMSMGVFVGPAVFPAAFSILYERANGKWCAIGSIVGLCSGITAWCSIAASENDGVVTIATLGTDNPFLGGNLASILVSGFVACVGSITDPDTSFKWEQLTVNIILQDGMPRVPEDDETVALLDEFLEKDFKIATYGSWGISIFLCFFLPVVLEYGQGVQSATDFGAWIWFFLLWCFAAGLYTIVLPIVELLRDIKEALRVSSLADKEKDRWQKKAKDLKTRKEAARRAKIEAARGGIARDRNNSKDPKKKPANDDLLAMKRL